LTRALHFAFSGQRARCAFCQLPSS
jgi:hypothetical protein